MRRLLEILNRPAEPVPTPREWLVGLPETAKVTDALAALDARLLEAQQMGTLDEMRAARGERQRLQGLHLRCVERDALQAERPAGCWCLGLGGREQRWAMEASGEPRAFWGVLCSCAEGIAAAADQDDARQAITRDLAQRRLLRLWASVPAEYQEARFPETTPEQKQLKRELGRWLEATETRGPSTWPAWLYLHGASGRGKTTLAVALLRVLAERGQTAQFLNVAELLRQLRASYRNPRTADEDSPRPSEDARLQSLYGVDVLVLDDLGAERGSDWATEIVYLILDQRLGALRRTIVTSNYGPGDLADRLGEGGFRVASRITGRCGQDWVIDMSNLPNLRLEERSLA